VLARRKFNQQITKHSTCRLMIARHKKKFHFAVIIYIHGTRGHLISRVFGYDVPVTDSASPLAWHQSICLYMDDLCVCTDGARNIVIRKGYQPPSKSKTSAVVLGWDNRFCLNVQLLFRDHAIDEHILDRSDSSCYAWICSSVW
jgi:hypothetical protein